MHTQHLFESQVLGVGLEGGVGDSKDEAHDKEQANDKELDEE